MLQLRRRRSRAFLDDRLSVGRDDLLGAAVQLGVLDQPVPVGEPGATLGTAVGLFALEDQLKCYLIFIAKLVAGQSNGERKSLKNIIETHLKLLLQAIVEIIRPLVLMVSSVLD